AAKALAQFSPANLEEKEKINLARLWYYQLTEQDKKAQEIWRLLMQDFLYQDWGNLVLSGVSPKAQEIEKAILLQLGSNRLFEKLFFAYKDQQKKIAFIEDYEGDLTGWVVHSPLIPMELRPPDLQIFNYLASEDSSPNDFERWANYWIKKKQGVNLKKLGEIYQERYPKLEDGSIYLKKGENLIALEAGAREGANTNVAQLK
ncbi:MAG: hypothetical protein QNL04_03895, partial [SAR324 cluster bacterium]|nr:hypothetical protein [SAR324 cluster bacterium]